MSKVDCHWDPNDLKKREGPDTTSFRQSFRSFEEVVVLELSIFEEPESKSLREKIFHYFILQCFGGIEWIIQRIIGKSFRNEKIVIERKRMWFSLSFPKTLYITKSITTFGTNLKYDQAHCHIIKLSSKWEKI
jgi:hypothetical protein